MGNCLSYFTFTSSKQFKVIFHGLDAAGKTSVLYRWKSPNGQIVTTIPTIGFNVETLTVHGVEFTAWDVGGRDKIRPLWKHYYQNMDSLVFIVDSNDQDRMQQAKDEFVRMLQEDELKNLPVLLMCNKQDLPEAINPLKIAEIFGIGKDPACKDRQIAVVKCSALTGSGLQEGLDTLASMLHNQEAQSEEDAMEFQEESWSSKKLAFKLDENGYLSSVPASPKMSGKSNFLNPTSNGDEKTLQTFSIIKMQCPCPFARAARLWGGLMNDNQEMSLEMQAKANVSGLQDFTDRSNQGERLDGFCIRLQSEKANHGTPEEFGQCVRIFLTALADEDPSGENCMRVNYIGSRGWRFRFNKTDFFVTTFAPCYPETSSRYAFQSGHAFVLLQPEASFARHRLPPDTPETNWENPKNIRDKTRSAFRKAGRPYFIPDTTNYPMAEHIVKPITDDGVAVIRWWEPMTNT